MLHLQKLKSYPNSESFLRNPLTGGQYLPGFGVPGIFFPKNPENLEAICSKKSYHFINTEMEFQGKGIFWEQGMRHADWSTWSFNMDKHHFTLQ